MKHTHRGFSLIEVLVAMAVMATGLLAVATFQSELISGSGNNKARSEALALAQARIEQFRNYSDRSEFDTTFADTNSTYVTETNITGTNAVFTPKYAISGTGDVKTVEVYIEWTDRQDETQHVALTTEVGWESPRSVGDIVNDNRGELIPDATGRAYLGEGTLPDGATTTDNGDGTKLYEDGDNLKLVVGNDIVLTLEDACQTDTCIGFVKIKGKVYIDTGSTPTLDPGDVYVKASDAAYCHRYYYNNSGNAVDVAAATTDAEATSGGDYKFFHYTCYLGGGWHGNIGILLAGGIQQTDKICQGDPTSEDAYADPVISARRVYRGMLYKIDGSTTSGKEEIPNTNGLIRYYSVGVADQTVLPVPIDAQPAHFDGPEHDFVVASMAVGDTTGDKCISAGTMVRTDANFGGTDGALFAGVPTDFVCLNPSYVDSYDTQIYGVDNSCPFDPSDPPTLHYSITGNIIVVGPAEYATQVDGMNVVTSDGSGNCSLDPFAFSDVLGYLGKYTCDIYDWGNGWTGYVEIKPNTDLIGCDNTRVSYSGVQQDLTEQDLSCTAGDVVYVSGSVTAPMHHELLSAAIDGETGRCTVTYNTNTGNYDYECNTVNLDANNTWTGYITFTANDGVICHANGPESISSAVTYTGLAIGRHVDNFTIERGTMQCTLH
jgi:prepilin-type N-terminal cleavage/methylation domain-containing protein